MVREYRAIAAVVAVRARRPLAREGVRSRAPREPSAAAVAAVVRRSSRVSQSVIATRRVRPYTVAQKNKLAEPTNSSKHRHNNNIITDNIKSFQTIFSTLTQQTRRRASHRTHVTSSNSSLSLSLPAPSSSRVTFFITSHGTRL